MTILLRPRDKKILLLFYCLVLCFIPLTRSFFSSARSSASSLSSFLLRDSLRGWQTTSVSKNETAQPLGSQLENSAKISTEDPVRFRRPRQIRKQPKSRHPKYYWSNILNMEQEIRQAWSNANVIDTIDPLKPPPIPNESLLNYWKRNDLRNAIRTYGGRDDLAESLGNAYIVPGRWSKAVESPCVQELLLQDSCLSKDQPPPSPQQVKKGIRSDLHTASLQHENTRHTDTSDLEGNASIQRHKRGYWSSDLVVIQRLFEYLEERRGKRHVPAVWMPRLSDLETDGQSQLKSAIRRHGGSKLICSKAGLIPFREWNYIEGMYDLLLELRSYLDEFHGGDYREFPITSLMKEQGYERLYSLIQYYGGRKFVACRLSMLYRSTSNNPRGTDMIAADMNWGSFDLLFGIGLLTFVRNDQMKKRGPLQYPTISMPSQRRLMQAGETGQHLANRIQDYGGYENVARRMGLEFIG